MQHQVDIVIIGAGPVGLFAVFQLGMLGFRCHVIDALEVVGGQCAVLYPEKPIYDIPGHPLVTGGELVENLTKQTEPFKPVFHLQQQVVKVKSLDGGAGRAWQVETSRGVLLHAKAIVIAAGAGAFGPNRPPLPGIEAFEGRSVFYNVGARKDLEGKKIVIAGGGDSAVDWAIALAGKARHLYVVHRRHKFRAMPESEARLKQLAESGAIELVVPYQLRGLVGEAGVLEAVEVESFSGEKRALAADILLPFFGLSMELGPIASWGLGLDRHHITVDQSTSATNLPGIYAIGDISVYDNKLKLILCGFAEAAQAAYAVRKFLYPGEAFHFEYSTTKGIPVAA